MALVKNSVLDAARAVQLSRATPGEHQSNLFFASVYSGLGVPIAAGLLYPFFGILLCPTIAAAAIGLELHFGGARARRGCAPSGCRVHRQLVSSGPTQHVPVPLLLLGSFMLIIAFPAIDPVAIEIGPLVIRWYALAYLVGIIAGWRYAVYLARLDDRRPNGGDLDDFLTWAILGIILGGRLGYLLFYKPEVYLQNPLAMLAVWEGGMSFHGGLLGVIIAIVVFAYRRGIPVLALADVVACVAPIGLFLGRIANFINGELWGRVTDVPWAVVFPHAGDLPRHPSQLYEAFLEGLVLLVILAVLAQKSSIRRRPGVLTGVFLVGYGLSRITVEMFREPDGHLGFIVGGITMGQILSLPMVVLGLFLIFRACTGTSMTPRRTDADRQAEIEARRQKAAR